MGGRSRRKLGSRNYKNYTQEMLDLAVDLVKKKNITSLEAEKRFFIPRRTIENKVKGLHMKLPGAQLRLSDSEEMDIVDVLIAAADFGSPLSRLDLRILIYEYLSKNRRSYLFSGKIPGKWWVRNFLRRNQHALTERAVQNIKKVRAEKTVEEFENYFNNLERTVVDVPPKNILNYDETNLADNPGSTKCIFKRKVKYPERILNHSKGNISIMFAGSADGFLLPVYTVYKSEHLWSAWCVGGPPEARFNRTKSGWFDASVFEDWFKNVVIPWATKLDGPKVVIGDNLSSHLNVDILRICEEHDIRFAFLPPNSTHITQPLDVAYFGPLKKIWRRILTDYKIKNPSETQINKTHFPVLLKELLAEITMCNKDNLKAGFKATGIVPFNPQKVLRKLPDYEEEIKYKIDTALLDFLKKSKAPAPLKRTVANKKLKVEPGCSISSQDAEKLMSEAKMRQKTATKKSVPKNDDKRVTVLSDVRITPENQAYVDLRECSILNLKKIDAKSMLPLKKKGNENINPYENPEPSTSGTCKGIKRNIPKRKQTQTKKRKVDYDSDDNNEDNYSLRDTSDEETIMSEDEDMALSAILKNNRKYETDYDLSEILPNININNLEFCIDVETERKGKEELQDLDIDEIEQFENEEAGLCELKNVNINKIGKKENTDKGKGKGKGKIKGKTHETDKIGMYMDFYIEDEVYTNENKTIEEDANLDMGKIIANGNEETDKFKKQCLDYNTGETETKEKTDSESVNSNKIKHHIKINEKTDKQNKKCIDVDFDIDDEIESNENKSCEEDANLDMDKIIGNGNEDTDKHKKQCMDYDTGATDTKEKTDNEGVNSNKKKHQFKINEKTDEPNKKHIDVDFDIEDEIETNENKLCVEDAHLDIDKIIGNENEDTDKLKKQCVDEIDTEEKTDNEGVNSNKDNYQIKIYEKNGELYTKQATNEDIDMGEIKNIRIEKTDKLQLHENENTTNKNDRQKDVISEQYENENKISIYVKQSVIVRYYNRNNWKYYVGFVEKVDVQEMETFYSIIFLRTVKKPTLRFLVCKRDRDVVPSSSIVKTVKLHSVKENREYVVEECDEHYF